MTHSVDFSIAKKWLATIVFCFALTTSASDSNDNDLTSRLATEAQPIAHPNSESEQQAIDEKEKEVLQELNQYSGEVVCLKQSARPGSRIKVRKCKTRAEHQLHAENQLNRFAQTINGAEQTRVLRRLFDSRETTSQTSTK